jgi:hypothetical protein
VLFSEAHAFQPGEVRTYQLIARQIEAAILQAQPLAQTTKPVTQQRITPHAVAEVAAQRESSLNEIGSMPAPSPRNSLGRRYAVAWAQTRELLMRSQSAILAKKMQIAKDVSWHKRQWYLALAFLAIAVGLTCWIAYNGRRPISSSESSARPASTAIDPLVPSKAAEALPENGTAAVDRSVKPAMPRVRRVQVGKYEVDYIGEDVTVRYFTYPAKPQRKPTAGHRVVHIGDDVTVRYFAPTPVVLQDRQ